MQKISRTILRYVRTRLLPEDKRRHSLVGRADLWQMKRQFQIEYLQRIGLKPYHYLLDLGCGTLRGGIPMIDYLEEGHYYGLESRPNVLAEGKKELSKYKLQSKRPVLMLVDDLSKVNCGISFDFIWAFSVLIHMEDKFLHDSLDCVWRHLKQGGVFYANANIGEQANGYWQGFPVVWRSLDFYRQAAHHHGLHMQDAGTLQSLGHVTGIASQDLQRMLRFSKV